ncbi:hypothetical protein HHL16_13005 [Pseudoflavitalea sp. G-6-1-2]|uniref:hypothetical protein n=1 Tax=Pseudoflavitalea sp. G-6-1-2 TaxID=2728841 RepID=UPI00146DF193|nr:hypothetical protein [Pseudoflavitalea sp. G-6-1-2]NML21802.1 hypothetical protein [Pseudoflavitalea sp. G-6-1-2]
MKWLFLLSLCTLFFGVSVIAQDNPKENNRILPPSPTAASLGKYGEIPVSLYTGTPNISIPVYNIQSGSLSIPVGVSYHTGSVRPNDIPGWVGLGWSLSAGGVITRTVKDIPDDSYGFSTGSGTGFYYDLIADNPKFHYVFDDLATYPPPSRTTAFFWANEGRENDQKPDDFSFNFANFSGQFFFGQDAKIHQRSQQPLKIEFELAQVPETGILGVSSSNHINRWIITTGEGVKYYFDAHEWSASQVGQGHMAYISSWYLTSIISPTGETVTLEYTNTPGKYRAKESRNEKIGYLIPSGSDNNFIDLSQKSKNESLDQVIYLKKINFSNGYMTFNTVKRNDPMYLPRGVTPSTLEEQKLDRIDLFSNAENAPQKLLSWKFTYDEYNRLKLTSITKTGNAETAEEVTSLEYDPTAFEGHTGDATYPNPYDINSVDHWGYFNGMGTANKIPVHYNPRNLNQKVGTANRAANPNLAKASLLTKITWPTGGFTEFDFEPHSFGTVVEIDPNPRPPEQAWKLLADYYMSGPGGTNGYMSCPGDYANITFTLPEPTVIRKIISDKWVQSDLRPSCRTEYETFQMDVTDYLQAGTYNLNEVLGNRISTDCAGLSTDPVTENNELICLDHTRYALFVPNTYNTDGPGSGIVSRPTGGARIRQIRSFDGIKTTLVKTYEYLSGNSSSGVLNKEPIYMEPDLTFQLIGAPPAAIAGWTLASYPIKGMPAGSHIGYSEVTEKLEDGSKTVYFFTTYSDHADGKPYEIFKMEYGPTINNDAMRGLLTNTYVYNNAGNIVKSVSTDYDWSQNEYMGRMVDNQYIFLASGTNSPEGTTASSRSLIPSRFVAKKSETERIYNSNDQTSFLENVTEYRYNLDNLQIKEVKTTNSKKQTILSQTKYPVDFTGGIYDQMKAQNIILVPVEQKTLIGQPSSELTLKRTDFQMVPGNTFIKPSQSSSSTKGNTPTVDVTFDKYDNQGNILQLTPKNAPTTSYIWAYGGTIPIAEVKNAKVNDIAYTSFETSENGNWQFTDATRTTTEAVTGHKSYKLTSGTPISKTRLTATDKYIISYWSKNGAANVNGTAASAVLQKNGWTCYQHHLSGASTATIAGSNILIDELRLYPAGAMITTLTYDPLVGTTSQCDARNAVSYYEYDDLLRLLRIRDADKNILKQYQYVYKSYPHTNPIWESTGITRCKPCEANNNYVLNITQKQERDMNPGSSTYNQTRWIDGTAGNCVITADWQNTATAARCKKYAGIYNTGVQEREQKDLNPCSPTYNQTRWIDLGINLSACPLPKPYVKFGLENYTQYGSEHRADLVVRFYYDEALTIPYEAKNISLKFREEVSGSLCNCTLESNPYTILCNGSETILFEQVAIGREQHGSGEVDYISTYYYLLTGETYYGGD